jgi:hypothetical protein
VPCDGKRSTVGEGSGDLDGHFHPDLYEDLDRIRSAIAASPDDLPRLTALLLDEYGNSLAKSLQLLISKQGGTEATSPSVGTAPELPARAPPLDTDFFNAWTTRTRERKEHAP